jgi:iron complex transport system ATP-binding protein
VSLLELHDIRFAYGPHSVLRGISLSLAAGELVAIVGANGTGKTTLLRVAGGLLRADSGRVELKGHLLGDLARRAAARHMAAVPAEEEAVFPYTVRETVTLGRHPWRGAFAPLDEADRGLVAAALADTALDPLAERSVPELSSGERQRVAIARSLAQDADVYLLDEPTSHLDLGQRLRMLRLFRSRARRKPCGVLAVLHDLNLAAQTADRLLLLEDGVISAAGAPADVLTAARVKRAFGTDVEILAHPQSGLPVVVPLAPSETA